MNYYRHHLGDYSKDTGHLSLTEHGAYRLMLDHYYSTERPLPSDSASLYRICRAATTSERSAVKSVAATFFAEVDGRLVHKRVEIELREYAVTKTRNLENGKRGGRPPKTQTQTEKKPGGFPLGNQHETQPKTETEPKQNPSQKPLANSHVLLEKEPKGGGGSETPTGPARKPSESDREAQRNCTDANAVTIPLSLATMPGVTEFRKAWAEWCDYRTERATTGLKSARIPWTARAATNALAEIERVAAGVGLPLITSRIREAMAGSWQGLNLNSMNSRQPASSTSHQPPRLHDTI